MWTEELPEVVDAIMLDDEKESREQAKGLFSKYGINLYTTGDLKEFEEKQSEYDIVISDLRLAKFKDNGDQILRKLRSKNKDSFMAIYSGFGEILSNFQRTELKQDRIEIFQKSNPDVSIPNLKLAYFAKTLKTRDKDKSDSENSHRNVNRRIALSYLYKVDNKNVNIPIEKLKRFISVKDLIVELENESNIGDSFALEFIETIALIHEKR